MHIFWIKKTSGRHSDSDVTIKQYNSKRGLQAGIRFRNSCYRKINPDGLFLKIGMSGDGQYLYFASSNEVDGYKVKDFSKDGDACSIRPSIDVKKIEGEYDLRFDSKAKLYFIDLKSGKAEK